MRPHRRNRHEVLARPGRCWLTVVLGLPVSLAGQAALAADPSHAATTVSISGKVLAVSAADGKANRIEIYNALGLQISGDTRPPDGFQPSSTDPGLVVRDAGDSVTPGPAAASTRAACAARPTASSASTSAHATSTTPSRSSARSPGT